jgi:Spy/CpxP family protein refolding chaperone
MTLTANPRRVLLSFLFSSAALVALFTPAAAQTNGKQHTGNGQQKIESLKIAYITQQLNLDPAQAQKFWPVYNQYQAALHRLSRQRRKNLMSEDELHKASDSEIERSLDQDFSYQKQALQIREEYRDKFRKVLPPEKVAQLYRAERDFNLKLIRELHRRQKNGQSGG